MGVHIIRREMLYIQDTESIQIAFLIRHEILSYFVEPLGSTIPLILRAIVHATFKMLNKQRSDTGRVPFVFVSYVNEVASE